MHEQKKPKSSHTNSLPTSLHINPRVTSHFRRLYKSVADAASPQSAVTSQTRNSDVTLCSQLQQIKQRRHNTHTMKEQRCCLRMVAAAVPLMLAMVMERAAAMEAFTEKDLDNYYKRMYDFGLGKRAYVYSANKRPMYDFGIGKRDSNRQRMYAFGLGKRATLGVEQETPEDDGAPGVGDLPAWKRALRNYEFGLGKRAQGKMYSFGLGKRASYSGEEDDAEDSSDVEKRSRYQFGLGKRAGAFNNDRFYDGSSERSLRSQRYNFGLGKRDLGPDWEDLLGDDANHDLSARSMKYGFGLGKREISNEALDDVENVLVNSEKIPASMLSGGHKSNTRKRDITSASASHQPDDKQPPQQRR
ncbi:hypothetical protein LSTR_LSTR009401 [Laodelphax striatellus]|uniref:Allatostatins n=1 Tax=Laodelphax striatellus TaxID=195883 RepID=A0A482WHP6_LAOST|nr:hypothetical protein LSTR_LSTR009401 [Laodelphax striatellus]